MLSGSETLVSCFLPVFNAEKFLEDWWGKNGPELESVKAKLIVVDNGSSDRTPEILKSIQYNDIKIIRHEENLGLEASFKTAKAEISTKYRFFLPADDWLAPGYLSNAVEIMEADEEVRVVYGRSYVVDPISGAQSLRAAPFRPLGKYTESACSALAFNNFVTDISLYRSEDLDVLVNSSDWFLPGNQACVFNKGKLYHLNSDQCFSGKGPGRVSNDWEQNGKYFELFEKMYAGAISSDILTPADLFAINLLHINFLSGKYLADGFNEIIKSGHPYVRNAGSKNLQKIILRIVLLLVDDLLVEPKKLQFKETGRFGTLQQLLTLIGAIDSDYEQPLKEHLKLRGAMQLVV